MNLYWVLAIEVALVAGGIHHSPPSATALSKTHCCKLFHLLSTSINIVWLSFPSTHLSQTRPFLWHTSFNNAYRRLQNVPRCPRMAASEKKWEATPRLDAFLHSKKFP